jgi:hypothetical protein
MVPRASRPVFMFFAPGLIFGDTEGVGSHFHVLRSRTRFHVLRARTHFRRYQGHEVSFSCCALPDSFSAVPRASGLVFSGTEGVRSCFHVFGGSEGVGSRFLILRDQTLFRRYQGRRVPFSCFALLDSFSAVRRASGPFFMFCAPGLIFGGNEGVGSRFHVLCARTRFRLYRGRRVSFSCFTLPDTFSAVPRASGRVFMFSTLGLVFGGIEGVGSRFHVFALPDSFSAVPGALGPVFIFSAPGLMFGGTEGVGSRFQILCARTHFRRY